MPEMSVVVETYLAAVRLARATDLARLGRFKAARELLIAGGRPPCKPRELDLLARMAAQEHEFGIARGWWEAALRQSPENVDYSNAIAQASEAERMQVVLRSLLWLALLIMVLSLLVYLCVITWQYPVPIKF